nr:hypothetical protein CFP56_08144 [Quercus suber]
MVMKFRGGTWRRTKRRGLLINPTIGSLIYTEADMMLGLVFGGPQVSCSDDLFDFPMQCNGSFSVSHTIDRSDVAWWQSHFSSSPHSALGHLREEPANICCNRQMIQHLDTEDNGIFEESEVGARSEALPRPARDATSGRCTSHLRHIQRQAWWGTRHGLP